MAYAKTSNVASARAFQKAILQSQEGKIGDIEALSISYRPDETNGDIFAASFAQQNLKMDSRIDINGRIISDKHPPFIIAEMSANHNGRIEEAFKIIDLAVEAEQMPIKMQTYRPDTLNPYRKSLIFRSTTGCEGPYALRSLRGSAYSMGMAQASV